MPMMQLVRRASVATSLAAFAACNFFDVSNPGPIADDDLNNVSAMTGLVVGMSFDLSRAVDELNYDLTVISDELYHGGSYAQPGLFTRGIIRPEDVNAEWGEAHRARWVAESGIERMKDVLGADFDKSPLAARAYIYAGLANRLLGENMCFAVIDGSEPQDFKVHFSRAEAQFTEALRIAANLTGAVRDSLNRAAYGGRASVRAAQGKWSEAVPDALQVPTGYTFVAFFSTTRRTRTTSSYKRPAIGASSRSSTRNGRRCSKTPAFRGTRSKPHLARSRAVRTAARRSSSKRSTLVLAPTCRSSREPRC